MADFNNHFPTHHKTESQRLYVGLLNPHATRIKFNDGTEVTSFEITSIAELLQKPGNAIE